jgi:hypothetical protein
LGLYRLCEIPGQEFIDAADGMVGDVQRLLPQLATYLGHKDLRSTQHYLTMTPELLERASLRFLHYANPGGRHA